MYYETRNPDLVIDITTVQKSGSCYRVKGVGINPEDDSRYEEIGMVVKKATSKKDITRKRNAIITELLSRFESKIGAPVKEEKRAENGVLAEAYLAVRTQIEATHATIGNWNYNTTLTALNFFEKNTLPLISGFAEKKREFLYIVDQPMIEGEMRRICLQNGAEEATVDRVVAKHLYEADIINAVLRDYNPTLPDITLRNLAPRKSVPLKEQIKSLPYEVLLRFYSLLKENVKVEPRKVFFAVFVVYGCRPAEAAGRKPHEIDFRETYCTCKILTQEKDGKIVDNLKTDESRRTLLISYWGKIILQECIRQIGDEYPKDDTAMNIRSQASQWVRDLLIKAGCQDSILSSCAEDIDAEPDYDANNPNDIACFALRRVACSIMRNVCGFSFYETNRQLGHVDKKQKHERVDMNLPEEQQRLALMMERYVYDKEITLNPKYHPFKASGPKKVKLIEFPEYTFMNNTSAAIELDFNMIAAETGESITVEMPRKAINFLQQFSMAKSWAGVDRLVIGNITE